VAPASGAGASKYFQRPGNVTPMNTDSVKNRCVHCGDAAYSQSTQPGPHANSPKRSLCAGHYERFTKHGDARPEVPLRRMGAPMKFFLAALKEADPAQCLLWIYGGHGKASGRSNGRRWNYGTLRYEGRTRLVTQLALELTGHERPSERHGALHACDTPACFNPYHLRWGTQAENIQDAKERGRMTALASIAAQYGLTEEEVHRRLSA